MSIPLQIRNKLPKNIILIKYAGNANLSYGANKSVLIRFQKIMQYENVSDELDIYHFSKMSDINYVNGFNFKYGEEEFRFILPSVITNYIKEFVKDNKIIKNVDKNLNKTNIKQLIKQFSNDLDNQDILIEKINKIVEPVEYKEIPNIKFDQLNIKFIESNNKFDELKKSEIILQNKIIELNKRIDILINDNNKLSSNNADLADNNKKLSSDNAYLVNENKKLLDDNKNLDDENKILCDTFKLYRDENIIIEPIAADVAEPIIKSIIKQVKQQMLFLNLVD